tara:strand:+ start:111 stop:380 length:270 start_codon:yes stop_codon:yes gene_type:complete
MKVTKHTNEEIKQMIIKLRETRFKKCNILNTFCSKTISFDSHWLGNNFTQNLYLEKINDEYNSVVICVSNHHFYYNDEGIKEAVKFINE